MHYWSESGNTILHISDFVWWSSSTRWLQPAGGGEGEEAAAGGGAQTGAGAARYTGALTGAQGGEFLSILPNNLHIPWCTYSTHIVLLYNKAWDATGCISKKSMIDSVPSCEYENLITSLSLLC